MGEHRGRKAPGDRGLYDYGQIIDTYGNTITVRTSSAACVPPRCWIFVKNKDGKNFTAGVVGCEGGIAVPSPHLSPAQAKRLVGALERFIRSAEAEIAPKRKRRKK